MASPDNVVINTSNTVTANLNKVFKSFKMATITEVSLFGVSQKKEVEEQRFAWMGEDGVTSGGVIRLATDMNKVEFLPQQIRTFLLTP